jgi:hypothetical protein
MHQHSHHDCAAGTSVDDVIRSTKDGMRTVRDIAEGVVDLSCMELAPLMRDAGTYVWNPSNFTRDFYYPTGRGSGMRKAFRVPPLGVGRIEQQLFDASRFEVPAPEVRFVDEGERGDVYTFDPDPAKPPRELRLPLGAVNSEVRHGEHFRRITVSWDNTERDHRLRIHIKLPQEATSAISDVAFGALERPAIPEVVQGKDRLNGYPASKFVVAGGLAVLLDRCAEWELLPDTNELAITLVRSNGALSRETTTFRPGPNAPIVPTYESQVQGPIQWELAVMPWGSTDVLPWQEYEQFQMPGVIFESGGGGTLPPKWTPYPDVPAGVLSAILPDRIRTFDGTTTASIHEVQMKPVLAPQAVRDAGLAAHIVD